MIEPTARERADLKKCEACWTFGTGYVHVRTTNGSLSLCEQCLGDINRKSPLLAAAEARGRAAERKIVCQSIRASTENDDMPKIVRRALEVAALAIETMPPSTYAIPAEEQRP